MSKKIRKAKWSGNPWADVVDWVCDDILLQSIVVEGKYDESGQWAFGRNTLITATWKGVSNVQLFRLGTRASICTPQSH